MGTLPLAEAYSGENYTICKNGVFICKLSKSTSTLDHLRVSYSIKESHDKFFYPISEKGFDKYLAEARREGATIQWDRYEYLGTGNIVVSGCTGHQHCSFCSGCLEIENAELSYGDRTNFVKHENCIKCVKCGSTRDSNLHKAFRIDYCPDCGRIVNRKKQAEILEEFKNEEKRKQEEEEERKRRRDREIMEAKSQHKIPFKDPAEYKHNNGVFFYELHHYRGFSWNCSQGYTHEVYPLYNSPGVAKCIKCGEEGYYYEKIPGLR